VMGGHVRGFLEMVNASLADVVGRLRGGQLWVGAEVQVQNSLYDHALAIDSRGRSCPSRPRGCSRCRWPVAGGAIWGIPNVY
jgi:hypothetical protein